MNLDFAAHFLKYAHSSEPAGSCSTLVGHPDPALRNRRAIPIGIVMEHRFAFAHWVNCKQSLLEKARRNIEVSDEEFSPPDLVSFDWHDDFGCDSDFIESDLETLNQNDKVEVALFCWAALRSLNDGHIRPAVWLNVLGNVYIVQKQWDDYDDRSETMTDRYGNNHRIYYASSLEDLAEVFEETNSSSGVVWDVDLDYFTDAEKVDDQCYTPMLNTRQIRSILSPRRKWMQQILRDLHGVTIALEPDYTGGLSRSLELFQRWESSLFESPLFSKECCWKPNLLQT